MASYLRLNNKMQHAREDSQTISVVKGYPTLAKGDLKLSEKGLSPEQQDSAWKKVHDYLYAYKSTMIGHQANENLQCSGVLRDYLDFHINNGGDPFDGAIYGLNTKVMECAVLDYFAKLWNIEPPDSVKGEDYGEGYWGYVVSMGCSEANLYALYTARDYLSGKPLLIENTATCNSEGNPSSADVGSQYCSSTKNSNAFTPVVFYSEDCHHAHAKFVQILGISTFHDLGSGRFPCPLTYPNDYPSTYSADFLDQNGWPWLVPVDTDGSMYLPSLVKLVNGFASRGYPPIVIFTIGTSFKGSYGNPQAAINELVPILKRNNLYERHVYYSSDDPSQFDVRHGFWFHVDGALGAAHLPFLEMAINEGSIDNKFPIGFPVFDFRIPEVMSISMSLHKWFGCPFPSGIYMTRRKNQLKIPTNPIFGGYQDNTFGGSRNGHGVMVLWDFLAKSSYHDLTKQAVRGDRMVEFLLKKLQELEKDLGEDLWLSHNPGSLFICFKQPRKDIVYKYSLGCKSYLVKNRDDKLEKRLYSHICVMSHVDEEVIGNIITELREPGAFPPQNTNSA